MIKVVTCNLTLQCDISTQSWVKYTTNQQHQQSPVKLFCRFGAYIMTEKSTEMNTHLTVTNVFVFHLSESLELRKMKKQNKKQCNQQCATSNNIPILTWHKILKEKKVFFCSFHHMKLNYICSRFQVHKLHIFLHASELSISFPCHTHKLRKPEF